MCMSLYITKLWWLLRDTQTQRIDVYILYIYMQQFFVYYVKNVKKKN